LRYLNAFGWTKKTKNGQEGTKEDRRADALLEDRSPGLEVGGPAFGLEAIPPGSIKLISDRRFQIEI